MGINILGLNLPWWGWALILIFIVALTLRINKEWEETIILRLGKYHRNKKAGIFFIIPFIEKIYRLDKRTQVMDVKPQEVITSDSVTVQVDAVVYYKIVGPKKSILNVEEWEDASVKLAQTTLRDEVGKSTLDDLLMKKERVGINIQKRLDKETDDWGIKVENVEIKDVIIPKQLERAMAKEAEAIREKRARITKAEGEYEASRKFRQASEELVKSPHSILLRQLQTWQEIGAEQNSLMIVIPSDIGKEATLGLAAIGRQELSKIPKKFERKIQK